MYAPNFKAPMRRSVWASVFITLLFGSCVQSFGADNFWSGIWKLNEAKSSPQGASYSMTRSPQGEYTIVNTGYTYSFRCDSKDYPMHGQDSVSCVHEDSTTMVMVSKRNGKILASRRLELSKDGTTTTSHITLIHADGFKEEKTRMYVRFNASTGLEGLWKDTDRSNEEPKSMVTTLTSSTFRVAFPDIKQFTDMKIDGTDTPIQGLASGSKVTNAAKMESPLKMSTIQKIDGVTTKQGSLELSPDGKTLIQETWRTGSPSVRSRLVFDRQ